MKKKITEVDLCKMFVDAHPRSEYLYYEVHIPGGRCDIVHKEHGIISIYETKLQLNISLLEQCINRKPYANFVYAVVPEYRNKPFLEKLFSDYGIGIISFRDDSGYDEWRHWTRHTLLREMAYPMYNRNPIPITVYEENKKEIAGSQQSGVTPFALMVKKIKSHLRHGDKRTIAEVFSYQTYYGTLKQFKTNIYQWIRTGVIKDLEMGDGMMWSTTAEPVQEKVVNAVIENKLF